MLCKENNKKKTQPKPNPSFVYAASSVVLWCGIQPWNLDCVKVLQRKQFWKILQAISNMPCLRHAAEEGGSSLLGSIQHNLTLYKQDICKFYNMVFYNKAEISWLWLI